MGQGVRSLAGYHLEKILPGCRVLFFADVNGAFSGKIFSILHKDDSSMEEPNKRTLPRATEQTTATRPSVGPPRGLSDVKSPD